MVGPHYAASKAGILGLTHSYAHLLAKEGITVNAIARALIDTEMVTGKVTWSYDERKRAMQIQVLSRPKPKQVEKEEKSDQTP